METSSKWLKRCFHNREVTSRDGNMNVNVIGRDMIIKVLGWARSSGKSCRNSRWESRHGTLGTPN